MAANEPQGRGDQARRRFITRAHVEDAAAAGQSIRVSGRDTITDEAAQRAADLGVRIERDSGGRAAPGIPTAGPSTRATPAPPVAASAEELRSLVRAAVIAELGSEVPGLDAVIDRVLKSRSL
jgi:hypothetical protein